MIIELFGLPGSGKTTIGRLLNKNFKFITWDNDKVKIIYDYIQNNEICLSHKILRLSKVIKYVPFINKLYFDLLFYSKIKFSQSIFEKTNISICAADVVKKICKHESLSDDMQPHYISWEFEKISRLALCRDYIEGTENMFD